MNQFGILGVLCVLLFAAGCSRAPNDLRTFSDERDSEEAVASGRPSPDEPNADPISALEGKGRPTDSLTREGHQSASDSPALSDAAARPPAGAAGSSPRSGEHATSSQTGSLTEAKSPRVEAVANSEAEGPRSNGADAPSAASSRPPRVPEPLRVAMLPRGDSDLTEPSGEPASRDSNVALAPREPQLLIPEKDFQRVDPNRSLRVSYDDLDLLKVLNMEPVPADCTKMFPDWLKSLDGAQVRIRGFMIPPIRETGLPSFTLARDNQICCFGREPKVYDVIPVRLKSGTTTDYIPNRPFDVVGRFAIRPDVFRGELQNLYEIEDAQIIAQ